MNPGSPMKATTEEIVAAYREFGSIWKAARALGMAGQSVWERLRSIGYPLAGRKWTEEEEQELVRLIGAMPISHVAEALGRPYYGVAIKASRLGVAVRIGNRIKRKIPRGSGLNKADTSRLVRDYQKSQQSLRKFARARGLHPTALVEAIKRHAPEAWVEISRSRGMEMKTCPGCGGEFFPMTGKQVACGQLCSASAKRDREYFGGKRSSTIGLREGLCQLCGKARSRGLHSHHVFGKDNDPDNDVLIALCPGCHSIIGKLAVMKLVDDRRGWETLIHWVTARRRGEDWSRGQFHGTFVAVEIEHLSGDENNVEGQHGESDEVGLRP